MASRPPVRRGGRAYAPRVATRASTTSVMVRRPVLRDMKSTSLPNSPSHAVASRPVTGVSASPPWTRARVATKADGHPKGPRCGMPRACTRIRCDQASKRVGSRSWSRSRQIATSACWAASSAWRRMLQRSHRMGRDLVRNLQDSREDRSRRKHPCIDAGMASDRSVRSVRARGVGHAAPALVADAAIADSDSPAVHDGRTRRRAAPVRERQPHRAVAVLAEVHALLLVVGDDGAGQGWRRMPTGRMVPAVDPSRGVLPWMMSLTSCYRWRSSRASIARAWSAPCSTPK